MTRVVLDTNVLLISLPSRSAYRPIFEALLNGEFELAISNDILSEYIEVLERKANIDVATNVAELLLNLDNVLKTEVYFNWHLISEDEDDNKFVDCAVAAQADLLVSNDHHFRILLRTDFPRVNVIDIDSFLRSMVEK